MVQRLGKWNCDEFDFTPGLRAFPLRCQEQITYVAILAF